MKKPKIALVLSGGGARGIAHIGVIEELLRRGYEISSVAGTSMGALVGGMYASGNLQPFKVWMESLDKYKVFSLLDFSFSGNGLVKGDRVIHVMKQMIPDVRIEQLPIPFAAVAADWVTGEEVVFERGGLYHAIRASISIPSFFKPLHAGNRMLIDGGTVNPLPVNRVQRTRGDLLIAVDVCRGFLQPPAVRIKQSNSSFKMIHSSMQIMQQQITRLTLAQCPPDIVIPMEADRFGVFEMYRAREIVAHGHTIARQALDAFEGE